MEADVIIVIDTAQIEVKRSDYEPEMEDDEEKEEVYFEQV